MTPKPKKPCPPYWILPLGFFIAKAEVFLGCPRLALWTFGIAYAVAAVMFVVDMVES